MRVPAWRLPSAEQRCVFAFDPLRTTMGVPPVDTACWHGDAVTSSNCEAMPTERRRSQEQRETIRENNMAAAEKFDAILVGSGQAGNPLAASTSELPRSP